MSLTKKCIVFALDKTKNGRDECVELYVFDECFNPIVDEMGKRLEKGGQLIKLQHPSLVASPSITFDHCHFFFGYTSSGSRVYRAGGNYIHCPKCVKNWNEGITFSKSVDCWDALTGSSWSLPEMKVPRAEPRLLILRGTLFAIGGCRYYGQESYPFVEYFVEDQNAWFTIDPPENPKLDLNHFVCGALEERGLILIGSRTGGFVELRSHFTSEGKISSYIWMSCSSFRFEPMLEGRIDPAAVVHDDLFWLDRIGTTLVRLNYNSGEYCFFDLADLGLLPSRNCMHYYPRLVHLGEGKMALIWRDKNLYLLGESEDEQRPEELVHKERASCGFHCINFMLSQQTGLTVLSHKKCIGASQSLYLSAALVVDVGVPTTHTSLNLTSIRGSDSVEMLPIPSVDPWISKSDINQD